MRAWSGRRRAALDGLCIALVLAAGVALFRRRELVIAGPIGWASFPLDDAFIHFHFARNLVEGHGFSYNPGVAVAGSTAPLWTLALGAAFWLGGSDPVWAKALGLAAALAAAWAARSVVAAVTGRPGQALLAGVLTALAGPVVWGALSGMEVTLAAALATAALAGHAAGRDRTAALLVALAALARPEAMVLAPLVWLGGPPTGRRALMLGGPLAACLTPWVVFNLATAGSPLPATASAKVAGGLIGLLGGAREPVATALVGRPWQFEVDWVRWLASVSRLLPWLAAAGLCILWRRHGRRLGVPALALVLHPLAMAWLAPYQGPAFQEGRYSIHLLPLAIALAVIALGPLWPAPVARGGSGAGGRGGTGRGLVAGAAACALLAASALALPAAADRHAWAVQNIEGMQVSLGRWVAGHAPPDARLALNDVGAIAYLSRREIVDVMGLVTPSIIPYRRRGEPGVLSYLERACPDYLIVFPAWFPQITAMAERFAPVHRVRLERNTVSGADDMVVYTTPWSGRGARAPGCLAGFGRR